MTALQNFGLSVAPLGVALLIPDHPQQVLLPPPLHANHQVGGILMSLSSYLHRMPELRSSPWSFCSWDALVRLLLLLLLFLLLLRLLFFCYCCRHRPPVSQASRCC
jgi:hypothetical protein